jgi:hypothetical protein
MPNSTLLRRFRHRSALHRPTSEQLLTWTMVGIAAIIAVTLVVALVLLCAGMYYSHSAGVMYCSTTIDLACHDQKISLYEHASWLIDWSLRLCFVSGGSCILLLAVICGGLFTSEYRSLRTHRFVRRVSAFFQKCIRLSRRN